MIICGIEMKGSEVIIVILEGDKRSFSHINIDPKKIKFTDNGNQDEVRAFRHSIYALFRENKVELVAIKKRETKGQKPGGPIGFKLEGIIQLYDGCPVKLVAPQTIAAIQRKHSPTKPNSLNIYQYSAFETAFSELP